MNIALTEQDMADLADGATVNVMAEDGTEITVGPDGSQAQAWLPSTSVNDLAGELSVNLVTRDGVEVTLYPPERPDPDITVIVTRSAGPDGAVLIFVDTSFEPDGSDGSPGLRIRVNDEPVFEGIVYQSVPEDQEPAGNPDRQLHVRLGEITPQ